VGTIEKMLYGVIYKKAEELSLRIHAIGSVSDHVHIALSIPPKISVSECVKHFKGTSSYAINHMKGGDGSFRWQEGYGAVSISENALPIVIIYVKNQKIHHSDNSTLEYYEKIDE